MPDEEAFSLLVRLMYSYDLRGQFLPEMPKLQLRLVSQVIAYLTSSSPLILFAVPGRAYSTDTGRVLKAAF